MLRYKTAIVKIYMYINKKGSKVGYYYLRLSV